MIKRIVATTIEKRLLNKRGLPNFNVAFYIFNVKGEYAGVSLYSESTKYSVCTDSGPETLAIEPMFEGTPND